MVKGNNCRQLAPISGDAIAALGVSILWVHSIKRKAGAGADFCFL